jgi:ribose transport system ATP-binding protein
MLPFLEVKGLSKRFGATVALDDVSTTFMAGQIHCVLGENGAGKSTLGKIIGGVLERDSGHLLLEGREVMLGTPMRARELGIAVVFQELSMAADLSVRANLLLGAEPHRHPFSRIQNRIELARVASVLARLDVRVDLQVPVGRLPTATRQLLEVGKALIRQPRMIILDEPTAMLNETEKHKLYSVLSSLRGDGTVVVLITHHLDDIDALANHVSIMRDGRMTDSFAVSGKPETALIARKLKGTATHLPAAAAKLPLDAAPFLRMHGLMDATHRPATLTLRRGEIVGVYGVVGSGAQRVSAALSGSSLCGSGLDVQIDGMPRTIKTPRHARKLGIAYLPAGRASNGILPTRSIRENLNIAGLSRYAYGGVIRRTHEVAGTQRELQASAVKYTDMEANISVLSGGNQQKVLVSRVLASGTRVLVLEDPTAGVDIGAKRQILDAIRRRALEGLAVILVSSDLAETIELVDTLYTFYSGVVVSRYASPQLNDKPAIVADIIGQNSTSAWQKSGMPVPSHPIVFPPPGQSR